MHVVLGAAGGTGSALVTELAARGLPVRAVTRHPLRPPLPTDDVRMVDITDTRALTAVLEGATVVHHAAQPAYTHWIEEFPAMNESVIRATADVGARLVFADNLYGYGPGASPMTESHPQAATDRKGALRARLSDHLLAQHHAGNVPVVIGRSSDYHGPRGHQSSFGVPTMQPLLTRSGPVQWIGSLDTLHTVHFLPDIARALVTLALDEDAYGRAWHLPAAEPLTARAFFEHTSRAAGVDVSFEVADETQPVRSAARSR